MRRQPRPLRASVFPRVLSCVVALLVLAVVPATALAHSRIVVREGIRTLVAIPPAGGPGKTLVHLRRGAIFATAASRNGAVVAFASRTFHEVEGKAVVTVRISTVHSGHRPRVIRTVVSRGAERSSRPIDSISLSPDGRRLLYETRSASVFLLRSDGTGLREVRASRAFDLAAGRNSTRPEFTPDGRRIIAAFFPPGAAASATGGIGTVALTGGRVHLIRHGGYLEGGAELSAPTVSPDGSHIAFQRKQHSGYAIWVMDRDGTNARRVARIPGWLIGNPSFSPSGRALVFVGDRPNSEGITVIGKSPSALFEIPVDGGGRPRKLQVETAHIFDRNPNWVH